MKPRRKLERLIAEFAPDAIHIATEGPLGWAGRAICRKKGYVFTTSYHTSFPEYLAERLPVPLSLSYAVLRRFPSRLGRRDGGDADHFPPARRPRLRQY